MPPTQISELKKRVDQALEDGELSADAQQALIDVLTPDHYEQTWPDIEVVLYVAEHPVVAEVLDNDRLDEPLEKALLEAFSAVLPLLGTRAFGPLKNFAHRTRKRLDAERRKYELVGEHVSQKDAEADAVRLLRNYISTEPAPLFVARLRQRFPKLVAEAERQSEQSVDLAALTRDQALVDALVDPQKADAAELVADLADKLGALVDDPDVSTVTLQRALAKGSADQKLVAAAVAAFDARADFAPDVIALVVSGADYAAQLAVIAGVLSPLVTRQAFAQFLADVAWQNPEEPEAKITAERTHAILSARCLLPKIGSPLEPVTSESLPPSVDTDALRAIPDRIDAAWALWQALANGPQP